MTNDNLKGRDWSSDRAATTKKGPIGSGTTVETHVRGNETFIVEKDRYGQLISVKKA